MPKVFSESLNQGRFEIWNSKPEMPMHFAHQVHGVEIVSIETLPCDADGLMVSWEQLEVPLAIKTADCLPIVIEGEKGIVFLHAGWKGLSHGILERPEIRMMIPQRAFIGPSIHACCFEVSEDFKNYFPHSSFFIKKEGTLHFDLQKEAKHRLREQFPNLLVTIAPLCTCCHQDLHSYRRNKTIERNWNLYIKG